MTDYTFYSGVGTMEIEAAKTPHGNLALYVSRGSSKVTIFLKEEEMIRLGQVAVAVLSEARKANKVEESVA